MKTMNHKKPSVGTVIAGVAGAVAVAGVAVAAAVALKDEKTRTKLKNAAIDIKDQAADYIEVLSTDPHVEEAKDTIKKVAADGKNLLKKSI